MPVERHHTTAPVAAEWDELADRAGVEPFLRPGWIDAWLRAFGRGRLVVYALRREGRLAAVVPLLRRRGGALASPTNWHTPVWGVVAEDDEAAEELLAAVLAERPRLLSLSFLGPGLDAARRAAARSGYATAERVVLTSPTLELKGDLETFLASRSRKRSKALASQRRKLEGQGTVELESVAGLAKLDEALALEGSGWKLEQGTAILSRPEVEQFYREVAAWSAERGSWRTFILRVDGRGVAGEMDIEDNGVLYNLKGGYDPELRAFAPGLQIARDRIAWCYANGLRRFEMLGAVEQQKTFWSTDVHERRLFQAFAPSIPGRIDRAARVHGRPIARRVARRVLRR